MLRRTVYGNSTAEQRQQRLGMQQEKARRSGFPCYLVAQKGLRAKRLHVSEVGQLDTGD